MWRLNVVWMAAMLSLCVSCGGLTEDAQETEISVGDEDSLLNNTEVLYVFDQGAPDGDIVIGPHAQVYFPRCVTFTGHKVTVLEGSVLTFAEGACMAFSWGASLQVQGKETDSVYFRPAAGTKHWGYVEGSHAAGLDFYGDNAGHSSIAFAIIDSATTGIWTKSKNGIAITHSRISHSQIHGVDLDDREALDSAGIRHCRFVDNKEYDIYMRRPSLLLHLGDSLSVQHDLKIAVTSGTIDSIGRIENPGSPVRVLGEITISEVYGNAAVTVAAGTAFLMDTGSGWWAQWGSLTLEGTPDAPIRLSPLRPGTYWDGIEANSKVSLSHVELDSAEIGIESVRHANVEIRNSVIRGCSQFGLLDKYGDGMLGDSGLAGTRFVGNAKHASLPPADLALFGEGNAFDSAGAIELSYGRDLAQSARIRDYGVPYQVTASLHASADTAITITVDPGVHMDFAAGKRFLLGSHASLDAQGTASDSIIFDELEAGLGWGGSSYDAGGVTFNYNAGKSHRMSYVSVRHAGQGIFIDNDSELDISYSTLARNTRYGIYVGDHAVLSEGEGMNYVDNGSGNVRLPD